jgi:hypothetical protein
MKMVALVTVVALALTGCWKEKSQPNTEYNAGRVFQGYKDGGDTKADQVFRGSRVLAVGKVENIYAMYSVKNPDVGTEKIDVVKLGEKSTKPNATLSCYSIKLVNVKDAGEEDEVTAEFQSDRLTSVNSIRIGTVIRIAGKLGYGHTHKNGTMLYITECEILK